MKRLFAALVAAAFLIAGAPTASSARQVGLLDPGFGDDGRVTMAFDPPGGWSEDSANAVAVQPDGKIVVAGTKGCRLDHLAPECSFAVARYDTDGMLDPSFSGDGVVLTHFSSGAAASDLALQPDGKIVVVGSAAASGDTWGFAAARYHVDGTLDTTFGGDGRVKTFTASDVNARSVALQPDGRIVLAGTGIARYEANGSLDATFGTDGYLASASATDLAIQPDGKIVTAGHAYRKFAVSRFESDGTPDSTFDLDGKVTMAPETGSLQANGLALQADGRIVVTGAYRKYPGLRRFALARFTSGGAADVTFGGDGLVTTRLGSQHALAHAVAIQPDGRIVVAGVAWYGAGYQDWAEVSSFAVARYNGGGSLDQRFSGDGKIVTYAGNGRWEQATSVVVQPDGAIVVAGQAGINEGDFGIVRYVVPPSRPDALLKQRSAPSFIGDDVYGIPGWKQTWNAFRHHGATFTVRAENDGSSPDTFVFDGCAPTSSFSVRYSVGTAQVTRRVVAGTFRVGPIAPGAVFDLGVTIHDRPSTPDGANHVCRVRVTSAHEAAKSDIVRTVVYVGPVGCFPEGIRGYREEISGCAP
jgi:uncharacterized delta-60 repeat protein